MAAPPGSTRFWLWELLIFVAMVGAECSNVAVSTLYKSAVIAGLNYHVYMTYSYAVAGAVLLLPAYLVYRNTPLPPLGIVLIGKFFILAFLGFTAQYLIYLGIAYSNPTLNSAMSNLTPACTFALAILFRLENIKMRSLSGQAKIFGALVSIAGALVIVLYNGPILLLRHGGGSTLSVLGNHQYNWVLGGALIAAGYLVASIWYIFQSIFAREYPAEFILVFFYGIFAFLLSLPIGIISEPHLTSWIVPADVRLLSIFSSGILGTGISIIIHMWGLRIKGPIYVTMFKPLSIAIAVIAGILFLGDNLYLGSVVGSVIITVGFYTIMWGKLKEEINPMLLDRENVNPVESLASRDEIVPLVKS